MKVSSKRKSAKMLMSKSQKYNLEDNVRDDD